MIHGITGLMNSGKTLYMTYKGFLAWCNGKTILTNYDVIFPHYKINMDWLIDISKKEDMVLNNVCFLLDELWIWLDCRKSQKNTVGTYFFLQSSKDDSEIYFTAQHNKQMDNRIRLNMHKISQCSRVIKQNNKFLSLDEEQRFLPIEYQQKLYIEVVTFKRMNLGMYTELVPTNKEYIKANNIFPLFDTTQKIVKVA